jgi:thymidylate synthase
MNNQDQRSAATLRQELRELHQQTTQERHKQKTNSLREQGIRVDFSTQNVEVVRSRKASIVKKVTTCIIRRLKDMNVLNENRKLTFEDYEVIAEGVASPHQDDQFDGRIARSIAFIRATEKLAGDKDYHVNRNGFRIANPNTSAFFKSYDLKGFIRFNSPVALVNPHNPNKSRKFKIKLG